MSHIYAVSDATGTTAERVVRAALVQFDDHQIEITQYGSIRTSEQIHDIVTEAARTGGFVVHTFVFENLRHAMLTQGRAQNVITIDLMGPLLARLSELLATPPRSEPGLFQPFDSAYLQRIDAINFTVRHDDGRNVHDLDQAEIVRADACDPRGFFQGGVGLGGTVRHETAVHAGPVGGAARGLLPGSHPCAQGSAGRRILNHTAPPGGGEKKWRQAEHVHQPVQDPGFQLRTGWTRCPEHALHPETRREKLAEDRRP